MTQELDKKGRFQAASKKGFTLIEILVALTLLA
ncbi:MAG: prepilin-type N-terminal cleavage/methylation domain-containing protein, partial [Deltaproteobacteria bacterium]|nr:prepilin-type N-terminal cleavage/methylation domain-containing protein [Deltaproteobacteria bacterium]